MSTPVLAELKEKPPAGALAAPKPGVVLGPKLKAGVEAGFAPKAAPKPPKVEALLAGALAPKPPNGELAGAAPNAGVLAPKGLGEGVPHEVDHADGHLVELGRREPRGIDIETPPLVEGHRGDAVGAEGHEGVQGRCEVGEVPARRR